MNHFVLGWRAQGGIDTEPASRALRAVTARLGFLDPEQIDRWGASDGPAAAAWVAHHPDRIGGVHYVHAEPDRLSLFTGRPLRWAGEGAADRLGPVDAGFYARRFSAFCDELDGRWAAARYDAVDGELEV